MRTTTARAKPNRPLVSCILHVIPSLLIVGCVSQSPPHTGPSSAQPKTVSTTTGSGSALPSTPKKDPFAVGEPTAEQEAQAKAATDRYFAALRDTILEIDDGTTSPDVIARAAVNSNLSLLREKARAQTAHIAASSWLGADVASKGLARLPEQRDIDWGVTLVLKLRQKRTPSSSPAQP